MSDHKERLDQSLSALMDGEATDMELHRLLKEVSEGSELRDKWKRYHMVSSALKGDAAITPIDYSAAISAAIDEEPSHRQSALAGFVGSAGRFAIAASVALVAVLGVQQLNSPLDRALHLYRSLPVLSRSMKRMLARLYSFPQVFSQLLTLAPSVLAATTRVHSL